MHREANFLWIGRPRNSGCAMAGERRSGLIDRTNLPAARWRGSASPKETPLIDANSSRWLSLRRDLTLGARLAAIVEPFVVILAATLAARFALDSAGVTDADNYLFREGAPPDFLAAARAEGLWHALRYGSVILLAVAIGWLRGRRSAASYGVSLGGDSLFGLIGTGLVLGLLLGLPLQALQLVHEFVPLGTDTPFWELRDRVAWDLEFWVYLAVGSFLIVPFVEEFTARGYVLGRLRESYSAGAALILMAVFFALAHGQYHRLEVLMSGQLILLALASAVLGYSVYRTGSLVPAIVAHALTNIPLALEWRFGAVAAGLIVLALFRRQVGDWLRGLGRLLKHADDWSAAVPAVGLIALAMLTLRAATWAPYAWLGLFLLVMIAGLRRRSPWAEREEAGDATRRGDGGRGEPANST